MSDADSNLSLLDLHPSLQGILLRPGSGLQLKPSQVWIPSSPLNSKQGLLEWSLKIRGIKSSAEGCMCGVTSRREYKEQERSLPGGLLAVGSTKQN